MIRIEDNNGKKIYIGFSTDKDIRYKATSGGVGTSIIKYLFEHNKIDYALSFEFNNKELKYHPCLISNFNDYNICGSVYQEMDMLKFYRQKFNESLSGRRIALFTLPCQTSFVKSLAKRYGIDIFIIGLTCSSQQDFKATDYLFKRIKVKTKDVSFYQYRGNGWPSGIQISLNDSSKKYIPNNGSIWTKIFHSRLFIQKRCFKCQDTLNRNSDIVLADPWLKEYTSSERIGKTLFSAYTSRGQEVVADCLKLNYLSAEIIEDDKLINSQKSTIERKLSYKKNPKYRDFLIFLVNNSIYRLLVLHSKYFFDAHIKFRTWLEKSMR